MLKEIVIVLGMHRSGTSLAAMSIKKLGCPGTGHDKYKDEFNPLGYHEDLRIVKINNKILETLKKGWGSFDHWLPLQDDWREKKICKEASEEIKNILKNIPHKRVIIKDPRIVILFKLWEDIILGLNINIKLVILVRNRNSVISSLANRDKMSKDMANSLYDYYNYEIINNIQNHPFIFFNYEDFISDEKKVLHNLIEFIDIAPKKYILQFKKDLNHGNDNYDKEFGIFDNREHPSSQLQSLAKKYKESHQRYGQLHKDFQIDNLMASNNWRLNKDIEVYKSYSDELENQLSES